MEDNYLDKAFKDKFELPQQHEFDEAAWDDLALRLDAAEPKRRIVPWQWLVAAGVMLPIFISSLYLYRQLRATEQTVAELETQMKQLAQNIQKENEFNTSSTPNQSAAQSPVYETQTIRTDATSAVASAPSAAVFSAAFRQNSRRAGVASAPTFIIQKSQNLGGGAGVGFVADKPQDLNRNNPIIANTEEPAPTPTNENTSFDLMPVPLNRISYGKSQFEVPKSSTKKQEKWLATKRELPNRKNLGHILLQQAIPVGFELGIVAQGGIAFAKDRPLESKPYFNRKGIAGAAHFASGIDFTLGLQLQQASYETKSVGSDFPNVAPTHPDDIFQKITITENTVQIPVGIKYNFGNTDALFVPFVELGAIAQKMTQKHYRYEYQPASRSEAPYAIRPKPQPVSESFAMNTVTSGVGVAWQPNNGSILDHLSLQVGIFATTNFENIDNAVTMIGVGAGAKYMF